MQKLSQESEQCKGKEQALSLIFYVFVKLSKRGYGLPRIKGCGTIVPYILYKKQVGKGGEGIVWKIITLFILVCCLTGCAGQPAAEELLRAPQLSAELSVVQKALNSYLGESAQLKYPHKSTTSSPFLFTDLDGDGLDEAVVLYQSDNKGLNVHLAVLEQQGQDWIVTQEMEGPSTNVENISSANLQEGGGNELVVLYSSPTARAEEYLAVYSYTDTTLKEKALWPCVGYLLQDVIGSSTQDVVMVRRQNQQMTITLLISNGEEFSLLPDLLLDKRFTNCQQISYFNKQNQHYIVVDGQDQSGYTITELLLYNEEKNALEQYAPTDGTNIVNKTSRLKPGLYSADINKDGIVEIPVVEEEITTVDSGRRLSFVSWRDFTRNSNSVVQFGVLDMEYGFFLRLPVAWKDKITVSDGPVARSWQVCSTTGDEWYVNVVTHPMDRELPQAFEEYHQVGFVGQTRLLVRVNELYIQQKEMIINGIYLL